MYFLHAINSDRQTRLLYVVGQIAMIQGDKEMQAIYVSTNFPQNINFSQKLPTRQWGGIFEAPLADSSLINKNCTNWIDNIFFPLNTITKNTTTGAWIAPSVQ